MANPTNEELAAMPMDEYAAATDTMKPEFVSLVPTAPEADDAGAETVDSAQLSRGSGAFDPHDCTMEEYQRAAKDGTLDIYERATTGQV